MTSSVNSPPRSLVRDLMSAPVAAVDAFDTFDVFGVPHSATLFPEEDALTGSMTAARRARFAGVRDCARQGMRSLGLPAEPILRGPRGEPVWPAGLTGSMTHTAGYHAAAVARHHDVLSIGLDAEPNQPLRYANMLALVSLEEERTWVTRLTYDAPEVHWDRLLFSAKECVYKVCYPVLGSLGFGDALITVDLPDNSFRATVVAPPPAGWRGPGRLRLSGRWLVRDGLILTAMVLRRRRPTPAEPPCPRRPDSA